MRTAVLAVLGLLAACGKGDNVIDAPAAQRNEAGAPTDGGVGVDADTRCAACGPDQVCVAYHDGTCSPNIRIECQDRAPLCEGINCLQDRDCEFYHCRGGADAGPYICYSCPNDIAAAINCHGP